MIGFVDSLCYVGRTDAVSDLSHKRSAEAECIHTCSVGTLPYCTDDCLSRDEDLASVRSLADHAFVSDPKTCMSEMCFGICLHVLHEDRFVTDVAVSSKHLADNPDAVFQAAASIHLHDTDSSSLHPIPSPLRNHQTHPIPALVCARREAIAIFSHGRSNDRTLLCHVCLYRCNRHN